MAKAYQSELRMPNGETKVVRSFLLLEETTPFLHKCVPPSLIDSVIANPFDNGPRLVVADWYDENPDPEIYRSSYGDKIREQVNNYTEGFYTWVHPTNMNVFYNATVRRGFVDEISLLPSAWVGVPCRVCSGTRSRTNTEPNLFSDCESYVHCPNCNSTGWIDGAAKDVCSRYPITKIRFQIASQRNRCFDTYPSKPWECTGELSKYIQDGKLNFGDLHINTARGLMSDAAINIGRHLNGFPLIGWRKVGAN